MELKEGYKKSEFGFIPIEWDIPTISDCVENNGLIRGPFGGALKKEYFVPSGFKVYEQKNAIYKSIELGQYYIDKEKFVELSRFQIKANDFIISCSGTIGRIYLIPKQHKEGVINQALLIIRINSSKCSRAYFEHCFTSDWFQSKIIDSTQGGAMKNMVGMAEFKMTTIPLPPLPEQIAIANALSDMDALINQTEKLIEKKKAIKQGVMQELLKPKEGWVTKKLGEVVEKITTGKLDANAMKPDGDYRFYTCAKEYYFIDKYAFDDEALLISGNGANVGYIHYYKGKFNAYQRTYVLTGFEMNIAFIKIYLDKYLSDRIATEVSAGNTPYIKMDTISEMNICYPERTEEQESISSIINDLTREFDKLETKLQKLKLQKQGMMQALLTGKIRLV
jgi:type I restriction enzyme S subunit